MPHSICGTPIFASSEMIARSQTLTSVTPPPSASPFTAAMNTAGWLRMMVHIVSYHLLRTLSPRIFAPLRTQSLRSRRSTPAQKARPRAVMTIAECFPRHSSMRSWSCITIGELSAFIFSGRLNVMTAYFSNSSKRIRSSSISELLRHEVLLADLVLDHRGDDAAVFERRGPVRDVSRDVVERFLAPVDRHGIEFRDAFGDRARFLHHPGRGHGRID